jgi:hydrogenase expression/formation protein HypC
MCLAVPARVLQVDGPVATVVVESVEYKASLMLLDDVVPGEYVMVHAGFAIARVDEAEAMETLRLLKEISNYDEEPQG